MDIERFRNHPLTLGFQEAELQQFAQLLVEHRLAAGRTLCREGERIAGMFLVPAGHVSVTKRDAEGNPQTLAELQGPTILGELEFVSGTPCSATVTAHEALSVYLLKASALEKLVSNGTVTVAKLLRNISREVVLRLQALNERYVEESQGGWGSISIDG